MKEPYWAVRITDSYIELRKAELSQPNSAQIDLGVNELHSLFFEGEVIVRDASARSAGSIIFQQAGSIKFRLGNCFKAALTYLPLCD